jgi:hypothetical protein
MFSDVNAFNEVGETSQHFPLLFLSPTCFNTVVRIVLAGVLPVLHAHRRGLDAAPGRAY